MLDKPYVTQYFRVWFKETPCRICVSMHTRRISKSLNSSWVVMKSVRNIRHGYKIPFLLFVLRYDQRKNGDLEMVSVCPHMYNVTIICPPGPDAMPTGVIPALGSLLTRWRTIQWSACWHRSRSTLDWVMACLTAPSHYSKLCWSH